MGAPRPFPYEAARFDDSHLPASTFDPKAVTRASWEPKPPKPKQDGPLISFNRRPEYGYPRPPLHMRLKSPGTNTM